MTDQENAENKPSHKDWAEILRVMKAHQEEGVGAVQRVLKEMGVHISTLDRPISERDIQYLLDHWPYLQVVSIAEDQESYPDPKIVKAESSGWNIHNYGDALSSSPGEFIFGGGDYRIKSAAQQKEDDEEGGEGGAIINGGHGTIINQAFLTAVEMVRLAKALGWPGFVIVDGHRVMQWALWLTAMDERLRVSGFIPTREEQDKRQRVKRSEVDDQKLFSFGKR